MRCPNCGGKLDEDNYCMECCEFFNDDYSQDEFGEELEPDYDSMINDGSSICLNCTYWSVSPYGASHGMICRRGYMTSGPDDSCGDFVQSHHFANYGSNGEYQFNETSDNISNKLYHWRNNR